MHRIMYCSELEWKERGKGQEREGEKIVLFEQSTCFGSIHSSSSHPNVFFSLFFVPSLSLSLLHIHKSCSHLFTSFLSLSLSLLPVPSSNLSLSHLHVLLCYAYCIHIYIPFLSSHFMLKHTHALTH